MLVSLLDNHLCCSDNIHKNKPKLQLAVHTSLNLASLVVFITQILCVRLKYNTNMSS